tara:strand:+ start:403 stop:915 length:513 start_codon:yes stop_codon:yes gene_type:complete
VFLNELIVKGGPVLYLLFFLTLIIFTVLINKYYFVFIDKESWYKDKLDNFYTEFPPSHMKLYNVEKTFLSEFRRDSLSNIKLLDGLIGMCPMIGLLGTVYGMIEVFEVLSFLGTGNPRAMSSGVAKATIPTMASMVITLFGLYFRQDLTQRINKTTEQMKLLIKQKGYTH